MSTLKQIRHVFNPFAYRRRETRVVCVGAVEVGGTNPLRIQSMTTTSTNDVEATVRQTERLVEAGCEIVRITVPTVREVRSLEKIKNRLLQDRCDVPVVADIHFNPAAAMEAADVVEKIRINPGNYVDGKAFKVREYTDEDYQKELDRIEEKFTPLVWKLKRLNRALRIGTNHGSLSDRIMNRYGDTPLGMVESALEYTRICRKHDYHDLIFSMKASNPRVMIAAYRLLADRLDEAGWDYPFHLGVTEAGEGEDGRIKSAVGIGSLLEDGIGDTIRVSLTEEPESEIPVARAIASRYDRGLGAFRPSLSSGPYVTSRVEFSRRETSTLYSGPVAIGGDAPIRVIQTVPLEPGAAENVLKIIEERAKTDTLPEILVTPFEGASFADRYRDMRSRFAKETNRVSFWVSFRAGEFPSEISFDADGWVVEWQNALRPGDWKAVLNEAKARRSVLVLKGPPGPDLIDMAFDAASESVPVMAGVAGAGSVHAHRELAAALRRRSLDVPLLLPPVESEAGLPTAIVHGSLICDGLGDAIWVTGQSLRSASVQFGYNILQAAGARITKTEFVSCPSCGRTLFDLQITTDRIKSKTGHLKGVKIAIMGCIVNGPGEMADADFGYVGGGPGKINLYVGKTCVEKSIPIAVADEKLIGLIKAHGKWRDP